MLRVALAIAATILAAGSLVAQAPAKEPIVELSGTPHGTPPGEPWRLTITVRADSDDLSGLSPVVTIENLETGETIDYRAEPTGSPGRYQASVVFPEEGRYRYEVYEPFTEHTFTFLPLRIVSASAPGDERPPVDSWRPVAAVAGNDGSFPFWPVLGGCLALVVAATTGLRLIRLRRRRPVASRPPGSRARVRSRSG